jgi:hypothetical protein
MRRWRARGGAVTRLGALPLVASSLHPARRGGSYSNKGAATRAHRLSGAWGQWRDNALSRSGRQVRSVSGTLLGQSLGP